jgi:uncharacterized protein YciI
MHYLLFYEAVKDYVERREPYRAAHLQYAREAVARGELILGGAYADPPAGALLIFQGTSPSVAELFAAGDPYVRNGLIQNWHVREWTTVVGDQAAVKLP